MRKTALNTALWTTLVVSLGVSLSACSDGHEAVTEPMVVETTETAEVDAGDAEAEVAAVEEPAASEDLAVNVGAELYNKQCMACHATGLLNAPKFGDAEAWAPRIEKGVETLTTHSAEGFNQMPAQAYNGVTEDQIRAAVEYMIAEAS